MVRLARLALKDRNGPNSAAGTRCAILYRQSARLQNDVISGITIPQTYRGKVSVNRDAVLAVERLAPREHANLDWPGRQGSVATETGCRVFMDNE